MSARRNPSQGAARGARGRPGSRLATAAAVVVTVALAGIAGCGSDRSTLDPAGEGSREIATIWWILLSVSAVIFAVVLALLLGAILRRRAEPDRSAAAERSGRRWIWIGGIAVPFVVLVGVFALALRTLPETSGAESGSAMTIEVVGHQWFWTVRYPEANVRTANEIHIPTGETVDLEVTSKDVVHSLWVPRLNRKIDLIPGQTNRLTLHADEDGVYEGQCAEFCGLQHTRMGFEVIAEPREELDAWLTAQARPAPSPRSTGTEQGYEAFASSACVYCHRIAGTNASGTVGPDLTHVASRRMLGAGTIENTRAGLAAWILDTQHLKEGNKMPATRLGDRELGPLLDYLETLR